MKTGVRRLVWITVFSFLLFFRGLGCQVASPDSSGLFKLASLRQNYGYQKIIPSQLEMNILISLSHYPELQNTRICFCYRNIFTSMKAVPTLTFFMHRAGNRTYRIVINKKQCQGKDITQRITSSAFIGVIGHELGHIVDYSRQSNWGLFKLFFRYLFINGRKDTENTADVIAIDHGLGAEMIEFDELLFQDKCAKPSYLAYKKKYYNTPDHLQELIKQRQIPAHP